MTFVDISYFLLSNYTLHYVQVSLHLSTCPFAALLYSGPRIYRIENASAIKSDYIGSFIRGSSSMSVGARVSHSKRAHLHYRAKHICSNLDEQPRFTLMHPLEL